MRAIPLVMLIALAFPATAQDTQVGEALYDRYCATCHGRTGVGDGPMAPSMIVPPTDLTGLTARNQGVFPITGVVMRIDGRDPLVSHGSMMPVYGDFFAGTDVMTKTEAGQPMLTSQPIVDLLAYLQTIQQE